MACWFTTLFWCRPFACGSIANVSSELRCTPSSISASSNSTRSGNSGPERATTMNGSRPSSIRSETCSTRDSVRACKGRPADHHLRSPFAPSLTTGACTDHTSKAPAHLLLTYALYLSGRCVRRHAGVASSATRSRSPPARQVRARALRHEPWWRHGLATRAAALYTELVC